MTVFTDSEKNFIKRAIRTIQPDLEEEIDPTKREDLIQILRTFRGRGYITPRRMDQGRDFNLWHSIMKKLGVKIKTPKERLIEEEQKHIKSRMERLNEIHNNKINNLEQKLKDAKEIKEEALLENEKKIQQELDRLQKQQEEVKKRMEATKTARERIMRYKKEKKASQEKETDKGLMKCMECGEWFSGEKGLKIHMKKIHPEIGD